MGMSTCSFEAPPSSVIRSTAPNGVPRTSSSNSERSSPTSRFQVSPGVSTFDASRDDSGTVHAAFVTATAASRRCSAGSRFRVPFSATDGTRSIAAVRARVLSLRTESIRSVALVL